MLNFFTIDFKLCWNSGSHVAPCERDWYGFLAFIMNPHVSHHLAILVSCFCMLSCSAVMLLPVFHIAPSSANSDVLMPSASGKSDTISINNSGDNTLPCEVPISTLLVDDRDEPTRTCIVRSDRKSVIHAYVLPVMFFFRSLYNRPSRHSKSKALLKSMKTANVMFLPFRPRDASVCSLSSWSIVDLHDRKPAWLSFKRWYFSMYQVSLFTIIRSIILHRTDVSAIGLYESASCALCPGF